VIGQNRCSPLPRAGFPNARSRAREVSDSTGGDGGASRRCLPSPQGEAPTYWFLYWTNRGVPQHPPLGVPQHPPLGVPQHPPLDRPDGRDHGRDEVLAAVASLRTGAADDVAAGGQFADVAADP
jgi:hypothetical protein